MWSTSLVSHLNDEGAEIFINDINLEQVLLTCRKYDVKSLDSSEIFDFDMDIYSPCALGATLNPSSIATEKQIDSINQLEDENRDSLLLAKKAIERGLLVNAGGLINVYSELKKFSREEALDQTRKIYNTTLDILNKSKEESITSYAAALKIANARLASKNKK